MAITLQYIKQIQTHTLHYPEQVQMRQSQIHSNETKIFSKKEKFNKILTEKNHFNTSEVKYFEV